jgi:chorismate synthase
MGERIMRYLSAGESHGPCLTGIIEGIPAGLEIGAADVNRHLDRRQQGYGRGGRMAIERDQVEFLSGLRFNRTLGSPLTLKISNRDWENWRLEMAPEGERPPQLVPVTRPRPGHADLAGGVKYNHEDLRQVLERSSARETAMRTAVGSVARLLLERFNIFFYSRVIAIGTATAAEPSDPADWLKLAEQIESSPFRCACPSAEAAMRDEVEKARRDGDTLGGVFEVVVTGVPPGLGSHVHWDRRLDGRLAAALMSIQGIKGVEIGSGFAGASAFGSALHDPIEMIPERGVTRPSNRAGGLEGGISNGQPLVLRAAMKPIPTLARPLQSVDLILMCDSPGAVERSDLCAVPAAAVVAEAAAAWELAVAFREKFAGDFIEEVDAAYDYYMNHVRKYLGAGISRQ